MRKSGRTGWYVRVLREAQVARGAGMSLVARPHPQWTVAAANAVMHDRIGDTAALAALPELAASWRDMLGKRLAAD